jgi:hypothetical protein
MFNALSHLAKIPIFLLISSMGVALAPVDEEDPARDESCYERYRNRLDKEIKKAPSTRVDLYIAWEILKSPIQLYNLMAYVCEETNGPIKLFPTAGKVLGPALAAPISTAMALTVILITPATLTIDGIKYAAKSFRLRKHHLLIGLMSDLDNYVRTQKIGPLLERLLQSETIERTYYDSEAALLDLSNAYQANYFCPKEANGTVKLMSFKEILRDIPCLGKKIKGEGFQ